MENNWKQDSAQPYGTLASAKNWLTVREMQAELWPMSRSAYRFVHARIRHARVGRLIRVHRDDLDAALRRWGR